MRINNNLMAMNTHRQLGINTAAGAKSVEKLSSGYRINRAGDDAAGLAISEKMRGQIRGLNQASRNSQDAISLIQTAEGALNETQAILQRMRELAVQSANDTNVSTDRTALQGEIDQLVGEIDRIAETTEFNKQNLLDGSFTGTMQIGANSGQTLDVTIAAMDAKTLAVTDQSSSSSAKVDNNANLIGLKSIDLNGAEDVGGYTFIVESYGSGGGVSLFLKDSDGDVVAANSGFDLADISGNGSGGYQQITLTATDFGADVTIVVDENVAEISGEWGSLSTMSAYQSLDTSVSVTSQGVDVTTAASGIDAVDLIAGNLTSGSYRFDFVGSGEEVVGKIQVESGAVWVDLLDDDGKVYTTGNIDESGGGNYAVTFKDRQGNEATIGFQLDKVGGGQLKTTQLEFDYTIGGGTGVGIDISSDSTTAQNAVTTINDALESVSTQRAALGAVQNRLEHTIKNLDTSSENLQASESRIRDVDMAKEMMEFTKNNILQQAAQSMLAQANQAPQGVLQLLR